MEANRSQFFSKEYAVVTADYKDQKHELTAAHGHLKVKVAGGDVGINLINIDNTKVDITVKAGEEMDFDGLQFHKIAFKQLSGAITNLRAFSWQ